MRGHRISSPLRAGLRAAGFVALTLPLMPVQAVALAMNSTVALRLPRMYHRWCCRLFGIEIQQHGVVSAARPTLFVANHISYMDVMALSAAVETSFVAKREVASWPFFNWLARLQRTVFVERRRTAVHGERDDLARHLAAGRNLVLFAEGTSGDSLHVKPFKSALLSVAERSVNDQALTIQPVTIAYTRLDAMPLGRQWRPFVAWYGDMEMLGHMWRMLGLGRVTVVLSFHEPVRLAEFASRKALAQHCERQVSLGLAAANSGRMPPRELAAAGGVP